MHLQTVSTHVTLHSLINCLVLWYTSINPLPNEKFVDWSNLKASADDKIYITEKLKFVLKRVENMGKGENAGYQHFFFSHIVFKRLFLQGHSKRGLCGKELRPLLPEAC